MTRLMPAERPPVSPHNLRLQKLKTEIHRQLIEGLDMAGLHRIAPERLRREVPPAGRRG